MYLPKKLMMNWLSIDLYEYWVTLHEHVKFSEYYYDQKFDEIPFLYRNNVQTCASSLF